MNEGYPERPDIPEADGRLNLNRIRQRIGDIFVERPTEITAGHSTEWQRLIVPSPRDNGMMLDFSRLHPEISYRTTKDSHFLGYIQIAEDSLAVPEDFFLVGLWPQTERVELIKMDPADHIEGQAAFIANDIANHLELIEVRKRIEAAYLAL